MVMRSAPSHPKPVAHRPAVGGASANLRRGLTRQRLPMAAVALTVETSIRRAIARVQPTAVGVHTGRVLRTVVDMAATAEAAPCRAIAPVRPTAVDTGRVLRPAVDMAATAEAAPCRAIAPAPATVEVVDTDRVLRPAAEVLITVAAEVASTAAEAAAPMAADAADLYGKPARASTREAMHGAANATNAWPTPAGSATRTQ